MNNSVALSTRTTLCNPTNVCPVVKHFHPKKRLTSMKPLLPIPPSPTAPGNHQSAFCLSGLPVLIFPIARPFPSAFFHLARFQGSSTSGHGLVFHFFLWLNNAPLHGSTSISQMRTQTWGKQATPRGHSQSVAKQDVIPA